MALSPIYCPFCREKLAELNFDFVSEWLIEALIHFHVEISCPNRPKRK